MNKQQEFRKTRIEIILLLLVVSSLVALISGFYSHKINRDLLVDENFERLKLFHSLRKASLEDYLDSVVSEVLAVSYGNRTLTALNRFKLAWTDLGEDPTGYLKETYVKTNPFPQTERHKLNQVDDDNSYNEIHSAYHLFAKELLGHFGFFDLFLIDTRGNILYSVAKEDDFATNIRNGPYADTHLQLVFDQALRREGKKVSLSDFELYPPSKNKPAAFAGSAILDQKGKAIGVLVVQLREHPINELLQFTEGLGKTGETYIVGSDNLFRSQSRFEKKPTLLKTKVETKAASQGISGFSGRGIVDNYRDVRVLSVYSPIDKLGQRWVLIAEMEEQEVLNKLNTGFFIALGVVLGILTFAILLLTYNIYTKFEMRW